MTKQISLIFPKKISLMLVKARNQGRHL